MINAANLEMIFMALKHINKEWKEGLEEGLGICLCDVWNSNLSL